MTLLADLFPLFATLAILALVVFVIRLWVKIGRGAVSAGSRDVVRPKPVGLQKTPWELAALDRLVVGSSGIANPNLIGTVNRLIEAAAGPGGDPRLQPLPTNAGISQVAAAISQLEHELELGPHPVS